MIYTSIMIYTQAVMEQLLKQEGPKSLSAYLTAAGRQPVVGGGLPVDPRALRRCLEGMWHSLSKDQHGFTPGEVHIDVDSCGVVGNEVRRLAPLRFVT